MKILGLLKFSKTWNYFNTFSKYSPTNTLFVKRNYCNTALNVNTNVIKDVILFKYDSPKFFRYLNIFAICQFGFWSYLSLLSFQTLRDAPVDPTKATHWWEKINLGENKYRNGITIISFLVGFGILSISWMYSLRSVKYLILRKGGQQVTIVTYTPTATNRMFTVDLGNLSCKDSRKVSQSHLAIKVKGHYLHYLLDMKGEFRNPKLFDHTAGIYRKWKT
ncbi:unnamed protein product [Phaedon cochleariae]|uniref:Transmembrane protein 223 n=1 Tax=Phaedon cochleariae TaxID=80249 RepID=A0A9P0DK44_PHACE|nr:unnamed protein product [Phaedon cochleariae]